jgi:hypothetical protein
MSSGACNLLDQAGTDQTQRCVNYKKTPDSHLETSRDTAGERFVPHLGFVKSPLGRLDEISGPLGDPAGKFGDDFRTFASGARRHPKAVIAVLDPVQCCPAAEPRCYVLDYIDMRRKSIGTGTCSRCSARLDEGWLAGCSGNPRNTKPRTP